MFGLGGGAIAAITATAAVVLAGCGSDVKGDRRRPRQRQGAVRAKCGSCHTLARAGTRGVVGPNLDEAFRRAARRRLRAQRPSRASCTADRDPLPQRSYGRRQMPRRPRHGQGRRGRRRLRRLRGGQARAGHGRARARSPQGPSDKPGEGHRAASWTSRRDPSGQLAYKFSSADGARGQARRSSRRTTRAIDAQHRARGQRRRRTARADRQERRRLAASRSTSSPASTPSTAPCPATARAAWRARSPSSSGARRRALAVAPRAGSRAGRASYCCAARQKKHDARTTMITMSSVDHQPAGGLLIGERRESRRARRGRTRPCRSGRG